MNTHYYDYEVESAETATTYVPTDEDYRDWTEHLRALEEET